MGVSKSAVLILVLATGLNICINLVKSQRNGQFPFIFQNISLAADPSTTKFYTTTLEIGNKTDLSYNQTIFTNAVKLFYGGNTTGLYGFASVSNIESTDSPSGQTVVSYSVVYNYTTLYDGTGGKDSAIDKSIGNVTVVKNGIESDTMFNSLFFVNENSFVFNGEKLCGKLACSGNFVTCSEVLTGVTVECVSNCYSGICVNDGWCIQYNSNAAPVCSCRVSTDWWYVGDRCETYLHIWMLVVFVILLAAVLLLIIIVAVVCIRNLKHKKFGTEKKVKPIKVSKIKKEQKKKNANKTNGISVNVASNENNRHSESNGEQKGQNQTENPPTSVDIPQPREAVESSTSEESSDENEVGGYATVQPVGQVPTDAARNPSSSDSSVTSDEDSSAIQNYTPSAGVGATYDPVGPQSSTIPTQPPPVYSSVKKGPKDRTEDPAFPKITTV